MFLYQTLKHFSRLLRRVFNDARPCSPSAVFRSPSVVFPSLLQRRLLVKIKIFKSIFYQILTTWNQDLKSKFNVTVRPRSEV